MRLVDDASPGCACRASAWTPPPRPARSQHPSKDPPARAPWPGAALAQWPARPGLAPNTHGGCEPPRSFLPHSAGPAAGRVHCPRKGGLHRQCKQPRLPRCAMAAPSSLCGMSRCGGRPPSQLPERGGLQDEDVCCTARQDQVAFTVRFVRRGTSHAGVSVAPLLTEPGVPVQSRCPAGEVRETTTDTASSPKAAIGASCTSGLYQRIDEGSNGEALRRDSLQPFRPSPSKLPSLSWP